jgi:hypothetical protein
MNKGRPMSDYNFRIRQTEHDDGPMAHRIAKYLVKNAAESSARSLRFSVLSHPAQLDEAEKRLPLPQINKLLRERNRQPPPFPFHWKDKNKFGVTFARDQIEQAQAWVLTALMAGYVVFQSHRKGGWGGGRGLRDGDSSDDIEAAERAGAIPRKAR